MLYLKKVSLAKKILGYLSIILGFVILFITNSIVGLLFIVLGLLLVSTSGAEIDLEKKCYRIIISIFGKNLGIWKPCPEFEYVAVLKTKERQIMNLVPASTRFTSEVIHLNLFYDLNQHMTFYKTDCVTHAFTVAEHFKTALDIDILDDTDGDGKWL